MKREEFLKKIKAEYAEDYQKHIVGFFDQGISSYADTLAGVNPGPDKDVFLGEIRGLQFVLAQMKTMRDTFVNLEKKEEKKEKKSYK